MSTIVSPYWRVDVDGDPRYSHHRDLVVELIDAAITAYLAEPRKDNA